MARRLSKAHTGVWTTSTARVGALPKRASWTHRLSSMVTSAAGHHRGTYSRQSPQSTACGFDAVQATGGASFFAIIGVSAYGEWLVAMWLWQSVIG